MSGDQFTLPGSETASFALPSPSNATQREWASKNKRFQGKRHLLINQWDIDSQSHNLLIVLGIATVTFRTIVPGSPYGYPAFVADCYYRVHTHYNCIASK